MQASQQRCRSRGPVGGSWCWTAASRAAFSISSRLASGLARAMFSATVAESGLAVGGKFVTLICNPFALAAY